MIKNLKFLLPIFFCLPLSAQVSPGNLGLDFITAWFDASSLELGELTEWSSSYTNNGEQIDLQDNSAPYPSVTNAGRYSNYNHAVDFIDSDGDNLKALEAGGSFDLLDNSFEGGTGTFIAAYYLPAGSECPGCHIINYREATSGTVDGIQFRAKIGDEVGRLAIGSGNSSNASRDYTQDFIPDIVSYHGNRSDVETMSSFRRDLTFKGGTASGTTGDQGLYFGVRKFNGSSYNAWFDGLIYEVIFFSNDLSLIEYQKVHSYLAIKYGVTLDNTGGGMQGDYLSTNDIVIWDASNGPTYHNQVIGLGREDSEALLQKQSYTLGDSSRLYIADLADANVINLGSINTDISYVMMGHNEDELCNTASADLDIPVGSNIETRLAREYKLTNTSFNQAFNVDIRMNDCIDMAALDVADLRLLVDQDGDFSDGLSVANGEGIGFTINDGILSITGIANELIPANETRFITIGLTQKPTSSIDEETASLFEIYPNPVGDLLTVKTDLEGAQFKLYSVFGTEVALAKIMKENSLNVWQIDMSSLPTGSYLLMIGNAKKLVVKQ